MFVNNQYLTKVLTFFIKINNIYNYFSVKNGCMFDSFTLLYVWMLNWPNRQENRLTWLKHWTPTTVLPSECGLEFEWTIFLPGFAGELDESVVVGAYPHIRHTVATVTRYQEQRGLVILGGGESAHFQIIYNYVDQIQIYTVWHTLFKTSINILSI